jgi:hypothetical protein
MLLPQYPVYIPSKGRADQCLTARCLRKDGVPFKLVVEEPEAEAYAKHFGSDCLLILPWRNLGLYSSRNWIKEHSIAAGHVRHWQIDDNILYFGRRFHNYRLRCRPGVALRCTEVFVDRYENVAIAGLNYEMFLPPSNRVPPFLLNVHVYSITLVLNATPFRWRLLYNDDTDMCLQVLTAGWCTVAMNIFHAKKIRTMRMRGGNTDDLYQGDGRLKMARSLERMWPGLVETKRRWGRPQHVIKSAWAMFDTPLRRRSDIDWENLPAVDELGIVLKEQRPLAAGELRTFLEAHGQLPPAAAADPDS